MSALPAIVLASATTSNPLLTALGWCIGFVVAMLLMDWIDRKLP